jgi:AcrR family transcriptional regulator
MEATVEVVGAKGYEATSVGDIIKLARVSRTTFYEQFRHKEDCFVATYDERALAHFEHVLAAAKRPTGAKQPSGSIARLQAGVRAYLEALADEPALARMLMVEVLAAGPTAARSRDSVHDRFAELLRKWQRETRSEYAGVPQMPHELFEYAVGGVAEAVAARVRGGQAEQLTGLAPLIVTYLLNVAAVPAGRELAAALSAARSGRP